MKGWKTQKKKKKERKSRWERRGPAEERKDWKPKRKKGDHGQ
jgi:hypothetical protein